jgi:hypothetical protein
MPYIIAGCILLVLIGLAAAFAVRTARFKPPVRTFNDGYTESADLAGPEKLAAAIRVPTVSYPEPERIDRAAFIRLQALLRE